MQYESGRTSRNGVTNWIVGALLILAAVLIVDSVVYQLTEINNSIKDILVSLGWLSPILLFSLIALVFVLRCKDEKRIYRIGLIIILFSMLCRLAWVSVFDSYQVNDFGFYLNCGADAAATGRPESSGFCGAVYWKRAAFYTCPIALLFGKSLLAIKLANVLLATLTSWIFLRLGTLLFGVRLATVGLLFFIWQPDLWYSMTLASPDIPGLFWLAIFFFICAVLQRRVLSLGVPRWNWVRLAGLSVVLGVIIFFLDFTRTYHYGALLALGCYVVIESVLIFRVRLGESDDLARFVEERFPRGISTLDRSRVIAAHAAIWLVLPLGTYLMLNKAFWKIWQVPSDFEQINLICLVTDMDVLGTSTYEEVKDWSQDQCPDISTGEQNAYALRKLLHDLTHDPKEFFRYLQRKNRNLGIASDYLDWSTYTQPERWDTTSSQVKRINSKYRPQQIRAIAVAHSIVLLLLLWRLYCYPRIPFRRQEWILLSFSGCLYALFVFLLESQPRYDIFLIFLFSWIAAQAVDDLYRRVFREPPAVSVTPPTSRYQLYVGGAVLLAVWVASYWSAALAIRDSVFTLRDQSGFTQVPAAQLPAELKSNPVVLPLFVKNNYKELLLGYAPGSTVEANSVMAAQRTFAVHEKAQHHLRFFISVSAAKNEPYDMKINWTDTDLECLVAVNGRIVVRENLKDIENNSYYSWSQDNGLAFAPRMTLQFIVRNYKRIESVGANRAPVVALEYIDLQ